MQVLQFSKPLTVSVTQIYRAECWNQKELNMFLCAPLSCVLHQHDCVSYISVFKMFTELPPSFIPKLLGRVLKREGATRTLWHQAIRRKQLKIIESLLYLHTNTAVSRVNILTFILEFFLGKNFRVGSISFIVSSKHQQTFRFSQFAHIIFKITRGTSMREHMWEIGRGLGARRKENNVRLYNSCILKDSLETWKPYVNF